jgi:hypothetical protein
MQRSLSPDFRSSALAGPGVRAIIDLTQIIVGGSTQSPVPGSSSGAPAKLFKNLAGFHCLRTAD